MRPLRLSFGRGISRGKRKLKTSLRRFLEIDDFVYLRKSTVELNDVQELKKVFNWSLDPILLDDPEVYEFKHVEDVNQRRLRDGESLGTVVRNISPSICLDIGTGLGYSAALMSINAPTSSIYTVNIPPEEFEAGGELTTMKLEKTQIGSYYRERKLENITQILANTASWEPNLGDIDIAFIDGSHDTSFVINDTLKVLQYVHTGAFILWHDFNPRLASSYRWIKSVCLGVEKLFAQGILKGKIFHIRDSWIGIYRVEQ
jgi:predicted O-methyltransferase YrrM